MNPFLGVIFHWIGGLASGSFYVRFRRVRNWLWETLGWTYLFGGLWGLGGLTFGLAMRYLELSLGMGMALGYCVAFGTLLPPIAKSVMPTLPIDDPPLGVIASTLPGQITLGGIALCLLGIAVFALAGLTKEREMPQEKKREAIKEFNYPKGVAVATFCGITSACFAFALTAAKPIAEASVLAGTDKNWQGLPKLVVVLLDGFTTNFIWCLILNLRNRSSYEYASRCLRSASHTRADETIVETAFDAPGEEAVEGIAGSIQSSDRRIPLLNNYIFSALAGTTWYMQFFFYTMGETQMGRFGFASWTLHMASIMIFGTVWGVYFREWHGASARARGLIAIGVGLLLASTIVCDRCRHLVENKNRRC